MLEKSLFHIPHHIYCLKYINIFFHFAKPLGKLLDFEGVGATGGFVGRGEGGCYASFFFANFAVLVGLVFKFFEVLAIFVEIERVVGVVVFGF